MMGKVKWIGDDVTIVDALHVACYASHKLWMKYMRLRRVHGPEKVLFAVCHNGTVDSVHSGMSKAEARAKELRASK